MSLKSFHLVFITACIVVALGCGAWWMKQFISGSLGIGLGLLPAMSAFAFAVALVCYERIFLRKWRKVMAR